MHNTTVENSPTAAKLPTREILDIQLYPTKSEAVNASATAIASIVRANPYAVITYATGNTQIPIYTKLAELVSNKEIDFSQTTAFHLDEYYPCGPDSPFGFVHYLKNLVFEPFHISTIHTLNGLAKDAGEEAKRYNNLLTKHQPDLAILGIGPGGHIGFNEPGSHLDSVTRLVKLSKETVDRDHRERKQNTPTQALTQGISNILSAKKIILNAFGEEKGKYLKEALYGKISPLCPASFLRLVSEKVTIFGDLALGI